MYWLRNILLCPEGRLQADFPWSGATAAGKYLGSVWEFFKGSFLVPLLVLGAIFALVWVQPLYIGTGGVELLMDKLKWTGIIGAAIPLLFFIWRRLRHGTPLPNLVRMVCYSLIGAIVMANILLLAVVGVTQETYFQVMKWIASVIANTDGTPSMTFVMGLSTISFVMGFGMQMRYINRCLKADNISLRKSMALNLDSVRGSNWLKTAFNFLWPVLVAYGIVCVLGEGIVAVMGPPQQHTVDLARQATGGNFLAFALMAVIGAPLFEELIFRGFLYQVLRSGLRRDPKALVMKENPTEGNFLWLRKLWVRTDNCMRRLTYPIKNSVHGFLRGSPDLFAMLISSAVFSLIHMQFNPTTLVLLFVVGCVHAELYRRTGSLWCSIALHALNNGIDVLKIGMGH
jgi:membrane protease YdiL (CAAX protease family)